MSAATATPVADPADAKFERLVKFYKRDTYDNLQAKYRKLSSRLDDRYNARLDIAARILAALCSRERITGSCTERAVNAIRQADALLREHERLDDNANFAPDLNLHHGAVDAALEEHPGRPF